MTIAIGSPAADPVGRGGVKASVNSYFFERFGGAILQSTLDIGVNVASRSSGSPVIVALPATAQTATGGLIRQTQIAPTLTVPQGTSISVFVARDLDFTAASAGNERRPNWKSGRRMGLSVELYRTVRQRRHCRHAVRGGAGAAQHPRVGRHLHWQDHLPQRADSRCAGRGTADPDRGHAQIQLEHPNAVELLAARSALGEAEVTADDLVSASLRMRPDRIILGELRGVEAYALLRAVNSGHPGSMTTIHADSVDGAVEQLLLLVLQAGTRLTRDDVRHYARQVVGVFVQLSRVDGKRAVTAVALCGD